MMLKALPVIALLVCATARPAEEQKPRFSESGKKRIQASLQTIDENVRMAENNIRVSELNVTTIETELKILDGFYQEHVELKKKYESYLSMADEAIKKHQQEKGFTKLPSMPEPKPAVTMGKKQDIVREDFLVRQKIGVQDKESKTKWKQDADSKVARATTLLRGVQQNLRDIESRRSPLKNQLGMWRNRINEYKNVLTSLRQRKTEMEGYADKAVRDPSGETEEN